jgi:hypothetical protein
MRHCNLEGGQVALRTPVLDYLFLDAFMPARERLSA